MPIEFIGYVTGRHQSETIPPVGPAVAPGYIATTAAIHEDGGFDRVLVAFHSNSPDSLLIAHHAAAATRRLGLLIAHRPGFAAPTLAARQLATLDQLTRGRVAVHIITGGNDSELEADGDHTTKGVRYARASEYLDVLRREWSADAAFDHDGAFYRVAGARSDVGPYRPGGIPIYFGGASDDAIRVAGRHADAYALWGETYDEVAAMIARVSAAAAANGRPAPRFSLSFRPIVADTEDEAWARAGQVRARIDALQQGTGVQAGAIALDVAGAPPAAGTLPTNEGSRRLRALAARGERLDKRLWTGVAAVTGGRWNSTALVGDPDQVAEALLDYYRLGVTTFLIRGFDPLSDALVYGRDLIPRVRALVAQEDARRGVAAA
ncbi:alkanesulfonate monooxygenase [Gluconacetobacter johannae DSM 13595]|uniref:LLM class flavin-dependent oxidoreductase n=1 Tax=Gluconacetobacter johannae TaxID=112140 RepID=A0A7W4J570_9PROT|nr:LLM class flavin-dependent oxidoreductase [Gluconacetobacter johannae]MBB2174894.1 LLM class flavin-dependent oxidoreductase [Gluconacetobacter johannae]GBQ87686.1 alkanesulfonate monooxygenase [Gluconacetobacter johannae DSM 13595]